jgi:hypothetical protein
MKWAARNPVKAVKRERKKPDGRRSYPGGGLRRTVGSRLAIRRAMRELAATRVLRYLVGEHN